MDAADEMSDTMSETSLYSKRSMHSMRQPGTPGTPGARNMRPPPSTGRRQAGSLRAGSARGLEEAVSDASRDMGGLELEGWDEKFVYKVSQRMRVWVKLCENEAIFSVMTSLDGVYSGFATADVKKPLGHSGSCNVHFRVLTSEVPCAGWA